MTLPGPQSPAPPAPEAASHGRDTAGALDVETKELTPGAREWSTGSSLVPREEPLTLFVNGQELVTMLATPGDRLALAVGFLYDEGIIDRVDQLDDLEEDENGVRVQARGVQLGLRLFERRVLGSGCGKSFSFAGALDALAAAGRALPAELPWVPASAVVGAAAVTYSGGGLYARTRGTHAAALFDRQGGLVDLAEDIGRHNAVDKVIGGRLLHGHPLSGLFMVVTGRISSEMVGKIAKTPIPLVASKSVPTALALDYARRVSLCVVGRALGRSLSAYTFPKLLDPGA